MTTCGLDECGRGALAGPLVASAVVLNCSRQKLVGIAGVKLRDSKLLNAKQRAKIYDALKKTGAVIAVEVISHRQINNRGIGWANREIFRRLIKRINAVKFVVDGNLKIKVRSKSQKIESVVKADAKVAEVMAASIVAKVTRDKLMQELHNKYPIYGWKTNVGYGTTYHVRALAKHGMIYYHRSVFVTTALKPHP